MPEIGNIIGMLDRDGALHLDEDREDYGSWPEPGEAEAISQVDFESLGRDAIPTDSPSADVVERAHGIRVSDDVFETIMAGPYRLRGRDNAVPDLHILGWYQPVHFFASNWGIFIRESALKELARDLMPRFAPFVERRSPLAHVAVLIRAAFAFVFLHEHYHHKIESLAIRLHVVERRTAYPAYFKFSQQLAGTKEDIEEGIAGADAWFRLATTPYSKWFAKDELHVVRSWMVDLFENSPPPYRGAMDILSGPPSAFEDAENQLIARVQEATINPSRPFPSDFSYATSLTRSLFSIRQSIWSIVPVGQEPLLPTIPGALPLATDKLERFIVKQGWEKVPGGGKGSHAKYRDTSGRMIVLPHSKDVSRIVLSNTAQTLGVRPNRLAQLAR